MFGKKPDDISLTLTHMIDRSIQEMKYNQPAATAKMAEWIRQDRRFDGHDASALAKEAFDARTHGRQIRLEKYYVPRPGAGTGSVY